MFSCIYTTGNKAERLMHLVGWFIWITTPLYPSGVESILWTWQFLATQPRSFIELNPIVQCRIHKSRLLVLILCQIKPIPRLPLSYFYKIDFNIISPSTFRSSKWGLIPSGFPTRNLYVFCFSSMHATCPAQLIPFYRPNMWQGLKIMKLLIM